jgi:hypothetical protein
MASDRDVRPVSGQTGRPADILKDDRVKRGGIGAHLGESVERGMTGGQRHTLPTVVGDEVTSERPNDAEGDLGLEGPDRAGLAAQEDEERSADYPRRPRSSEGTDSPRALGMGPGDPGYTAEEDDEGDGRLPRKV